MRRYLIHFGALCAGIVLVTFSVIFYQGHRPYTWTPPKPDETKETLRVAADARFSPISFLDQNGNPAGHDVELIYAVGERMGVNMDVELVQWSEAIRDFKEGRYDLLLGVSNLPGRKDWIVLSDPYLNDPCVLFGNKKKPLDMTEFAGKRLAYPASDSAVDEVIDAYDLIPVTYSSYQECFEAMAGGECDYAIAPVSVGKSILKNMDDHEFGIKDFSIHNNIFSIGVQPENEKLLNRINASLEELSTSGELSSIYKNWMVKYVGAHNLTSLVAEEPTVFILLAVAISLILFVACLYSESRRRLEKLHQEKAHNHLLRMKNDMAAESIRNMQRSTTMLAEFRHDWQKHLAILTQYCSEDPAKAAAYIEELLGAVQSISVVRYTKNLLLNTILNVQAEKAAAKGVSFHPEVILPATLPIPDPDLCVVLMNLLDNAIGAAGRGEGKGSVEVRMHISGNDLMIVIQNTLPGDFDPAKFSEILRRKPRPGRDEHGFGIPSANDILKNYGGQLRYTVENGNMVVRTAMRLADRPARQKE